MAARICAGVAHLQAEVAEGGEGRRQDGGGRVGARREAGADVIEVAQARQGREQRRERDVARDVECVAREIEVLQREHRGECMQERLGCSGGEAGICEGEVAQAAQVLEVRRHRGEAGVTDGGRREAQKREGLQDEGGGDQRGGYRKGGHGVCVSCRTHAVSAEGRCGCAC